MGFPCGSIPRLQHLGRAVTRIANQARGRDVELLGRAIDHRLGSCDSRRVNGRRRLDIHERCVLQVDKIVVGIGVEGRRVGRSRVTGSRVGGRYGLQLGRRRRPVGRIIQNRKKLRDDPTGRRIEVLVGNLSLEVEAVEQRHLPHDQAHRHPVEQDDLAAPVEW
jgi:hypothetical protein